MTTLHFTAENFEATATLVEQSERRHVGTALERLSSFWVLSAPGYGPNHSVRIGGIDDDATAGMTVAFMTPWGWQALREWIASGRAVDELALAVSLLYSVPGVRVAEEPSASLGPSAADIDPMTCPITPGDFPPSVP